MCLAFAGTVSLAKIMVDVRSGDELVVSGKQAPPDWPIAFTLPDEYRWRIDSNARNFSGTHGPNQGQLAYVGRRTLGGRSVLSVAFQVMPPAMTLQAAAAELTDTPLDAAKGIKMGSIPGLMVTMPFGRAGGTRILAVGYKREGLAVIVDFLTQAGAGDARRAFLAICGSIKLKPWRVGR